MEKIRDLDAIKNALRKTGGNVTKAAKILGVTRDAIYKWLKAHGYEMPRKVVVQ